MKVRFFDPGLGYSKIKDEVLKELDRVLTAGDLILRDDVEMFEQKLADFVGTKYAVALNSGTDAIMLSLKAMLKKGDRVALPSHTFKSTCGAVLSAEMIPVLYDMGEKSENVRADAHIPVHIAGELSDFATSTGRATIEDACQALGALKNPTSDVQCWSFYPAKMLGALGDAGAITTNDTFVHEYIKEARNHFKGDNRDFGINSRMDNIQAAVLNIKFQYIDDILFKRKEIAHKYNSLLAGVELPSNEHGRVWQDYIIRTPKRDELFEFLKGNGIETMKNEYPFSPKYPKLPLAKKYEAETLRIPCNENLTEEEVYYVISKINEFSNV